MGVTMGDGTQKVNYRRYIEGIKNPKHQYLVRFYLDQPDEKQWLIDQWINKLIKTCKAMGVLSGLELVYKTIEYLEEQHYERA